MKNKLKAYRTMKNLSIGDLSKLANLSKSTISDIENDKITAKESTWDKLANALNISKKNLLNVPKSGKYEAVGLAVISLIERLIDKEVIKDSSDIDEKIARIIINVIKDEIDILSLNDNENNN